MNYSPSRNHFIHGVFALATVTFGAGHNACGQSNCGISELFPSAIRTYFEPIDVVAADVDGDTRLDLVWVNTYENTITAHLGTGTGLITTGVVSDLLHRPTAAPAAELNGDGRADLIVSSRSADAVTIFFASSDGAYTLKEDHPVASGDEMAIDDLNGDGLMDIVVAGRNPSTYTVLMGSIGGTFSPPIIHEIPVYVGGMAIADIDLDGVPDLLITDSLESHLMVYHGMGDGTFGEVALYPFDHGTSNFQVGDFNGDGRPDVAMRNASIGVTILLNTEAGSLQFHSVQPVVAVRSLNTADLNGDGADDLLATGIGRIDLWLANGDGSFVLGDVVQDLVTYPLHDTGDFDGDGHVDLALADRSQRRVRVLRGDSEGGFVEPPRYSTPESPVGMLAEDFDNDGAIDLITAHDGWLAFLRSDGADGFLPAELIAGSATPSAATAAFINDDDLPDIVTASDETPALLTVHINLGGTFVFSTQGLSTRADAITATDLDGDGDDDLVVVDTTDRLILLLENNGAGEFIERSRWDTPHQPTRIAADDLTGNGRSELVYYVYDTVIVARSVSQWSYEFDVISDAWAGGIPKLVDLDGDGTLDILAGDPWGVTTSSTGSETATARSETGM